MHAGRRGQRCLGPVVRQGHVAISVLEHLEGPMGRSLEQGELEVRMVAAECSQDLGQQAAGNRWKRSHPDTWVPQLIGLLVRDRGR
jgi:hypothetical protein